MNFNLTGLHVFIAMPAHRDINPWTVRSLMDTKATVEKRGVPIQVVIPDGSSLVEVARSVCADLFLKSECNRLFFIDSDIVWEPDEFVRILAMSTVMDVVLASYPVKRDPVQFFIHAGEERIATNEYGCLPNIGSGLGFTCIQRHVIEKLAEKAPKVFFADSTERIPHIFRCDVEDEKDGGKRFVGEDIAFFDDVRKLGIEVKLDPTIELGHHGSKTFKGRLIDQLKAEN
jgi:hypothetical protein